MSQRMRSGQSGLKRKVYEDRVGISIRKRRKLEKEQVLAKEIKEREESDQEEAMLEKLVFGDASDVLERLPDDDSFGMDTDGDSGMEEGTSSPGSDKERKPAWHDEEDSALRISDAEKKMGRKIFHAGPSTTEYSVHLKESFHNLVGTPKWADLGSKTKKHDDDSSDSDDELLQHGGKFVAKHSIALPRSTLDIKQVRLLNLKSRREGTVTTVQFHRSSTVGLVAGESGSASLFQVDGQDNALLHTHKISIKDWRFPVLCARFSADGQQYLAGSFHSLFFRFDMIEGRGMRVNPLTPQRITNFKHFQMSPDGRYMAVAGECGAVVLLEPHSGEYIGTLKMNGNVSVLAFNADGTRLFAHGDAGEVYVWDMTSRTCLMRFIDDGCIAGTALAISPSGQYVATGSAQGIVNIYESPSLTANAPRPCKIITNLTTAVTSLAFNANSEILAMASKERKNAIRLVHFPSMTVFSNFPGFMKPVSYPSALDFSVNSGYFAVGSEKNAFLYRLNQYGNY